MADTQGGLQYTPKMMKLPDPVVQIVEPPLDEVLNLAAGRALAILEGQHNADILEGESVRLRGPDEPQPLESVGPIDPIVPFRAAARPQEFDALVVAHRRCRDGSGARQLADGVIGRHWVHSSKH